MKMAFAPVLAIITGLSSGIAAVSAEPDMVSTLYASAHTIEDRVSARRAARQQADAGKGILDLKRERQQRRNAIQPTPSLRTRRFIPSSASSSTSSAATTVTTNSLLENREERRQRRLGNAPLPMKQQVIDAVNMERAKMGLTPLYQQIDLETSAQRHAMDMHTREYFSHENPDGLRSKERIKATGYGVVNAQECRCSYKVYLGENLAKGQTTIDQVIREWMESPSHRDAMLSSDYEDIGVGIVDDIWVLNFGKIEITR